MLEVQARLLAAYIRGDVPAYQGFTCVRQRAREAERILEEDNSRRHPSRKQGSRVERSICKKERNDGNPHRRL